MLTRKLPGQWLAPNSLGSAHNPTSRSTPARVGEMAPPARPTGHARTSTYTEMTGITLLLLAHGLHTKLHNILIQFYFLNRSIMGATQNLCD